ASARRRAAGCDGQGRPTNRPRGAYRPGQNRSAARAPRGGRKKVAAPPAPRPRASSPGPSPPYQAANAAATRYVRDAVPSPRIGSSSQRATVATTTLATATAKRAGARLLSDMIGRTRRSLASRGRGRRPGSAPHPPHAQPLRGDILRDRDGDQYKKPAPPPHSPRRGGENIH